MYLISLYFCPKQIELHQSMIFDSNNLSISMPHPPFIQSSVGRRKSSLIQERAKRTLVVTSHSNYPKVGSSGGLYTWVLQGCLIRPLLVLHYTSAYQYTTTTIYNIQCSGLTVVPEISGYWVLIWLTICFVKNQNTLVSDSSSTPRFFLEAHLQLRILLLNYLNPTKLDFLGNINSTDTSIPQSTYYYLYFYCITMLSPPILSGILIFRSYFDEAVETRRLKQVLTILHIHGLLEKFLHPNTISTNTVQFFPYIF